MLIFGMLMVFVTAIMVSMTNMSKDSLARTRAIEEARLGLAQIDRQVRSGNVIRDPSAENVLTSGVDPYFSMRIHTQEDGEDKCAQWRVIDHAPKDGFGDLEYRTWEPAYPDTTATTWSPVAHNLIEMAVAPSATNPILPANSDTWPPFWVDGATAANTDAQFVRITLRLKDPAETEGSKPTTLSTIVTGRNTVIGYPSDSCSDAPPP